MGLLYSDRNISRCDSAIPGSERTIIPHVNQDKEQNDDDDLVVNPDELSCDANTICDPNLLEHYRVQHSLAGELRPRFNSVLLLY